MSTGYVDNRIVNMDFRNGQFEKNVATTMATLDELKKRLMMEGAAKGLELVNETAKNMNLETITNGVNKIANSFSVLGAIGFSVIQSLTTQVMAFGQTMVGSMVIDPIRTGMQEYETQMGAIQTVLANTASKGTTLDQVNDGLNQLNQYADQTIYNFTEMTKNVGTFTAAGVALKPAISAIKGIANLAAISGSNSQQASTAMYQLSQAMASGTVKLMDWNSIVNAGMGGENFQKSLIQTAKAHGKFVEGYIKTDGSFRETLQRGWLTTQILTETLDKYTGDLSESQLLALGYTKEETAEIIKLGKMANDAATKVKTLTQLFSTATEAIQSGWTQTWMWIVGDFEEASSLFTEISNIFGTLIGDSSDARNGILSVWHAYGGREDLIGALRSGMNSLLMILKPLQEAMAEVFPATTGVQLQQLTYQFRLFMRSLTPSTEALALMKVIFKGLFSIVGIFTDFLGVLWKDLTKIISIVGPKPGTVLQFLADLGAKITAFRAYLAQTNAFHNILKAIAYGIGAVGYGAYLAGKFIGEKLVEAFNFVQPYLIRFRDWLGPIIGATVDYIKAKFKAFADFVAPYLTWAFGLITGIVTNFTTNVWPEVTSKFTEITNKVRESISSFVKDVSDKLNYWSTTFKSAFDSTNTEVNAFWKEIEPSLQSLKDALSNTFTGVNFEEFKKGFGIFEWLGKQAEAAGVKIKEFFNGFKTPELKIDGAAVGGFFKAFIDEIVKWIDTVDWKRVGATIQAVLTGAVLLSIKDFFKKGGAAFGSLTSVADSLKGILDGVRSSLEMWQKLLKSKILLNIAYAVAILTGSLVVLAMIPKEKLYTAITAITLLFIDLNAAMSNFAKVNPKDILGVGTSLLIVAGAILLMSIATSIMASINFSSMMKGLIGVGILLGELSLFLKYTKLDATATFKAQGIFLLAGAMVLMGIALKIMSTMDTKGFLVAIGSFSVAIVGIIAVLNYVDPFAVVPKAAAIVILSGSLILIAAGLLAIGVIDWNIIRKAIEAMQWVFGAMVLALDAIIDVRAVIVKALAILILTFSLTLIAAGLLAIGVIDWNIIRKAIEAMQWVFGMIVLAMDAIIDVRRMIQKAIAINIVALALLTTSYGLLAVGNIDWNIIRKAIEAMQWVFGMIVIALDAIIDPQSVIQKAVSILVVSGSLYLIALSLEKIGIMDYEQIKNGIVALMGVLAMISLALLALSRLSPDGGLAGAVAIAVVAGALNLLVYPLQAIGSMKVEQLAIAIGGIAAVMLVLGVGLAILQPVVPVLFIFAMGLVLLGAAVALAGWGLFMLATAFTLFAVSVLANIGVSYLIVQTLTALMPQITALGLAFIDSLALLMTEFSKKMKDALPGFKETIVAIFKMICATILEVMPELFVTLDLVIAGFIAFVLEQAPGIIQAGYELFKALLKGISDNIYEITVMVGKIVTEFIRGMTAQLPEIIAAGIDFMIALGKGIYQGIEKLMPGFHEAMKAVGKVLMEKMVEGFKAMDGLFHDVINWLVAKALDWLSGGMKGGMKNEGAVSGSMLVGSLTASVSNGLVGFNGFSTFANKFTTTMSKAVAAINDGITSDLDMQPTIRPIFDLSEIAKGSQSIDGILSGKTIDTGAIRARVPNLEFATGAIFKEDSPTGKVVQFVQNINSPKELSRVDIYRATRSQLETLKGAA